MGAHPKLSIVDPRPDAARRALAAARDRLERLRPDRSARRRVTRTQALAGLGLAFCAGGLAALAPQGALLGLAVMSAAFFSVAVAFRGLAAVLALVPAEDPAADAPRWTADLPRYTLLCPLYKEARALPGLMAALRALDYPKDHLDIVLALEADDDETRAAAARFPEARVILTPAGAPRTKPKALAYALAQTKGEFVTVYDAEDRPAPDQLRAALDAFAAGGPTMACVQAPLLIDNAHASWIARQFAVEYAILFLQILPLLRRLGAPVILGGTSNHFRRRALQDCGGWDPFNVTEDADIGYRLARDGWRLGLIAPPTWEEAPVSLGAWIRQRSRWIKGHLQSWLVLMRAPARAWRELGAAGFWTMQLLLLGGPLAALAHTPILLGCAVGLALGVLPAQALLLAWAGIAVSLLGATVAAIALRDPRIALAGLSMPLYWPLGFPAAARACYELIARPHAWAKTEHGVSTRATPSFEAAPCPSPSRSASLPSSPPSRGSPPGGAPGQQTPFAHASFRGARSVSSPARPPF